MENKIIMYNVFVHVVISQKLDGLAEARCFNFFSVNENIKNIRLAFPVQPTSLSVCWHF